MKISYNLFLNNKKIEISLDFKKSLNVLSQMNEQIAWKLIHNEDYYIESIVSNETVQEFFDALAHSKEPELDINNLFEFYLLSEEFGLMKEYLSQSKFKEIISLSFFKYFDKYSIFLRSLDNDFKKISCNLISHENYIAKNLDCFIDKHSHQLCELSINSLYNIFNNKERVLKDQNKAYNFITNLIKSHNSNYCVLLSCLDSNELSKEIVFESLENINQNKGFFPKNIFSIVKKHMEISSDEISKLKRLNSQLEEENEQLKSKNSQLEEENEQLESKNSQLEDENEQLESKNSQLEDENEQLKSRNLQNKVMNQDKLLITKIKLEKAYQERDNILLKIKCFEYISQASNFGGKLCEKDNVFINSIHNGNVNYVQNHLMQHCIINANYYEITDAHQIVKPALYIAVEDNKFEIAEILLSSPKINVNSSSYLFYKSSQVKKSALHLAVEREDAEMVRLLLTNEEIDVNANSFQFDEFTQSIKTALHIAVEKGNIEIIKLLLVNNNIDVNAISSFSINSFIKEETCEKTALQIAIENDNYEIVKIILEHPKININVNATRHFCFIGDKKIKCEKSVLQTAVEKENIQIVELLLKRNDININEFTSSNISILHIAVMEENLEIIKLLLKQENIDANIKDALGKRLKDFTNNIEIKKLFK